MRNLKVGDFISVSHDSESWIYTKACTQDFINNLLDGDLILGHIWQFGLHPSLLPDNWQLVERCTTSQMDWILRDRLGIDETRHDSVEQAFVEALEAAHPFEGRA